MEFIPLKGLNVPTEFITTKEYGSIPANSFFKIELKNNKIFILNRYIIGYSAIKEPYSIMIDDFIRAINLIKYAQCSLDRYLKLKVFL